MPVVLSPAQFEYLDEALKSNNTVTDFQETGDYTGVITTHDVTIDYTYDPLRQLLNFNIGAKHSLAAKIAGDNVITNHIIALIHNLKYPQPSQEQEEPASTAPPEESKKVEVNNGPSLKLSFVVKPVALQQS